MNNITKLAVSLAATSLLAACGSSGSSGSGYNYNTSTTVPSSSEASTPAKPDTSVPSKPDTVAPSKPDIVAPAPNNATGHYLKMSGANNAKTSTQGDLNTTALDEVVIDGHTVTIMRPNIYAGNWTVFGDTATCCGKNMNSKIGYSKADNGTDSYMFYNGKPTTDMPESGTATYKGSFLYDGVNNKSDRFVTASASYVADFSKKQLTGKLVAADKDLAIDVNSKISGNSFSGTATSSLDSAAGQVNGKFYGPKAAELAGMIEGNKNGQVEWHSVFIGKQ
ncbi:Slam-dependent surface lipoprotein [Psychrobacter lutiphocae]|uniref:Slam-dependent surface lipoprotein n=1 Tax=Psychrobacter lutiphocae TaxID=540500 RepID=UPI00038201D1|nr:Slam-dependent surface lipoprotein [Psychrobacter lutiphocae]